MPMLWMIVDVFMVSLVKSSAKIILLGMLVSIAEMNIKFGVNQK